MDVKASESADKRFAPRRVRRLPAIAYLEGAAGGVRCIIVDLSSTGARVIFEGQWDASVQSGSSPKRLRLVELGEKVTYDCWIVRAESRELGLRFAAPPVLPPAAPPRKMKK